MNQNHSLLQTHRRIRKPLCVIEALDRRQLLSVSITEWRVYTSLVGSGGGGENNQDYRRWYGGSEPDGSLGGAPLQSGSLFPEIPNNVNIPFSFAGNGSQNGASESANVSGSIKSFVTHNGNGTDTYTVQAPSNYSAVAEGPNASVYITVITDLVISVTGSPATVDLAGIYVVGTSVGSGGGGRTLNPGTYEIEAYDYAPCFQTQQGQLGSYLSATIPAEGKPDLVPALNQLPATASVGKAFSVSGTIKNQGQADAASSSAALYLSNDQTYDGSDVLLGTATTSAITKGSSQPVSFSVNLATDTRSGNYYLIARADSGNVVTESSETNNTSANAIKVESSSVSIVATDSFATEPSTSTAAAADTGFYTISRTGLTTNSITVQLGLSGNATNGIDYVAILSTVTIPAGSASVTVKLTPKYDTASEGNETAILTLASVPSGTTIDSTKKSATVTIKDSLIDLSITSLNWNNTKGGVDVAYKLLSADLTKSTLVELFWATGNTITSVIGSAIQAKSILSGTKAGFSGVWNVAGSFLKNAPAGASYLLAVIDRPKSIAEQDESNNFKALADVKIVFGANAVQSTVSDKTRKILSELLRMSGQSSATITSTARTPADQARIMFENTVNNGAQAQYNLYAAAGDKVIDVYVSKAAGLTKTQILAKSSTIIAAMQAKIVALGPSNVSRHCADPAKLNVVDIAPNFSGNGNSLFKSFALADTRISKVLYPPTDPAYHLEIAQV